MSYIYLVNLISVGIFGMILSAAFCNIVWTRQKRLIFTGSMAVILMIQGIVYFWIDSSLVETVYPFITHLPLTIVLCILSKKYLWSIISVLTAYLCCQVRRWLALFVVVIFSGSSVMQDAAELILTLPILLLLLRFAAPSVRSVSQYSTSMQIQFGLIPALYYGFDYLTRIYTDLLLKGSLVAVEFMPFVCSASYLIFVVRATTASRIRRQLEQRQDILKMQMEQAVREIETLRISEQKTKAYRHDLRHHMQYLSSCIENKRLAQAQHYIHEICAEIEKNRVFFFCENEAANLIFSAFAGRAKNAGISIKIKAGLSQNIPISENDLCVLLSNALENALHASLLQKKSGLPGIIEVTAYEQKGTFFFQFLNSCHSKVIFHQGLPVANTPGHGIGVHSICAIVEQYHGIYSFSLENNKFILRVSL